MSRKLFLILFAAAFPVFGQDAPRRVAVLTYNIHHGEGTDRRIDLERIARVIRHVSPDLVALHEVDRRTTRSGGEDQLAELARLTAMQPLFGKTIPHQGGEYGNAVLCRTAIGEQSNSALPGAEPRGLLAVRTGDGLWFLATHFDVSRDPAVRVRAAERINTWIADRGGAPALLAGDLNATPGSAPLTTLAQAWTIAGSEVATFPSAAPKQQIDFILYRPQNRWRVIEVRAVEEPVASDHRPLLAVLELLPEPR